MLLRHLYRLSLEESDRWGMIFGLPANDFSFGAFQIDAVYSYIHGLKGATHEFDAALDDLTPFFDWLRVDQNIPTKGWAAYFLEISDANHFRAAEMLFAAMHRYIIDNMPGWFVQINQSPLPSQIRNLLGVPRREDIRIPAHVEICQQQNRGQSSSE